MLAKALRLEYSYAEYVRFEKDARERHEFVNGLILGMAGGTIEHSRLSVAIALALGTQLRDRRCVVLESNARIRVQATGNAYYPDASVVCDQLVRDLEDPLSLANPTVLIEVLSPSTAEYDRTDKLADYQRIESLQHVVHVAHDAERIDVWSREADGWRCVAYGAGEKARLPAVRCELDVSEIYRDPLSS